LNQTNINALKRWIGQHRTVAPGITALLLAATQVNLSAVGGRLFVHGGDVVGEL